MVKSNDTAITIQDLKKTYMGSKGKPIIAVNRISLTVQKGHVFGFLGTNGAGKTTTLRMLTTLLPIDSGTVTVVGYDARKQPAEVRRRSGYVSQVGGSDVQSTAVENLLLQGRLYGMSKKEALQRTQEVIDAFNLQDIADRAASTYSGGQKRRLEIAMGIIHKPEILFLDEPTAGLDPQSRADLWDQIRALRAEGTTILLTTHYLDEADALSDRLSIMDRGRIVAEGTPQQLKRHLSRDVINVQPDLTDTSIEAVKDLLAGAFGPQNIQISEGSLLVHTSDGSRLLPQLIQLLDRHKIALSSISMAQPSLDDVFLQQIKATENQHETTE